MLTRALLVLLGVGLVAAAANRDYNNGRDSYVETNRRPEVNQTKIFCYLNATRFINQRSFRIQNVDVEHCTHIVYAAATITPDGNVQALTAELEHPSADIVTFSQLAELKRERNIKTILSIHGRHSDFSTMARSNRAHFVPHLKQYLKTHHFDGVNIDWRYPGKHRGNAIDDKQNYISLLSDLKIHIRTDGMLLTVSLPATQPDLNNGFDYDSETLLGSVDYWFIMALEYYNHQYTTIGANAPIIGTDGHHDVTSTIKYIKSKERLNRDSLKLILVIPFYGKLYMLDSELQRGESPIGQRFTNKNSNIDQVYSYPDICNKLRNPTPESWYRDTDPQSQTPYAINGKQALLYEDKTSVMAKTNLALKNGLGGVMAYSLELDDYEGHCQDMNAYMPSNNKQRDNDRTPPNAYPLLIGIFDAVQKGGSSAGTSSLSVFAVLLTITLLATLG